MNDSEAQAVDEEEGEDRRKQNVNEMNSKLIREATEAAVEDAIAMKRSDSFLSVDSNDEEREIDDSINNEGTNFLPPKKLMPVRSATHAYIENASIEASMISPGTHRIVPHGNLEESTFREENLDFQRSASRSSISDGGDSLRDSQRRRGSERYDFKSASKLPAFGNESSSQMQAIISEESDRNLEKSNRFENHSLSDLLRSNGFELSSEDINSNSFSIEVNWLHEVFCDFCYPPIKIEQMKDIYENEKGGGTSSVALPTNIVIQSPSLSLEKLLGKPLLGLPREWAMCLFRILIRILTNESDPEYNENIFKNCSWYEEIFNTSDKESSKSSARSRSESMSSTRFSSTSESERMCTKYSVVRLRTKWKLAIETLLATLETILVNSTYDYLRAPATRLLGVLCIAGVSGAHFYKILQLLFHQKASPIVQLFLLKTIRIAASGSARLILQNTDPRTFFSFSSGEGLTRVISLEKSYWPFRNDFGMALWFRAERFTKETTFLRVVSDMGDGIEVSVVSLPKSNDHLVSANVLDISILEDHNVINSVKVKNAILHEKVWYHVAVRHTRSRLKGVFSMGSREQIVVFLNGKAMISEVLEFPRVRECKSFKVSFGANFDGQTGALYVFNSAFSDSTLKALYELETKSTETQSRFGVDHSWDAHHGEIARKSKILNFDMRKVDLEDIVLTSRIGVEQSEILAKVVDIDEENESMEKSPLSQRFFNSRLYLVWDPRRTTGDIVLDLQSGAHVRSDHNYLQNWTVSNIQDVFGSFGGIQVILPAIRSVLTRQAEGNGPHDLIKNTTFDTKVLHYCSVSEIFLLLSSLIRCHNENARELLRCGAIDLLEEILHRSKQSKNQNVSHLAGDLYFTPISNSPSISKCLVSSLLELRSSAVCYIGLETKIFSSLVFNVPLWLVGNVSGISLALDLIPVLSSLTHTATKKVADCVGISGILRVIIKYVELETSSMCETPSNKDTKNWQNNSSEPSIEERWQICETLFAMVFQILMTRSSTGDIAMIVETLSKYLESEWEVNSGAIKAGIERTRSESEEMKHRFSLRASALIFLLVKVAPPSGDFMKHFILACGNFQACASWIMCSLVNTYSDQIRGIGVRLINEFLEFAFRNSEVSMSIELGEIEEMQKESISDDRGLQENTMTLISNVGYGFLNSNMGKSFASLGSSRMSKTQSSPELSSRVAHKLLWHLLKSHRFRSKKWTQASLVDMVFERRSRITLTAEFLRNNFLKQEPKIVSTLTLNWVWFENFMEDASIPYNAAPKNELALNTVIRLLRYLPGESIDRWLGAFLNASSRNEAVLDTVAASQDWQSCLFHLASECLESLQKGIQSNVNAEILEGSESSMNQSQNMRDIERLSERLELTLELCATLLVDCFHRGQEIALRAIEEIASLRRICLNGPTIFILIISKMYSILAAYGVLPLEKIAMHSASRGKEDSKILLKRSASIVTASILSNSTRNVTMPEAIDSWKSLRYLNAVVDVVISQMGFGVPEILAQSKIICLKYGGMSLDANEPCDIRGASLAEMYVLEFEAKKQLKGYQNLDAEKNIQRRICVTLAAQALSLLDAFIFPDSLDASLPASQLHGLTLVRNSEPRFGGKQGPLLASLVRLSLLLLDRLELDKLALLQACSRLRCFLYWTFELIRESEALDNFSSAFSKLIEPLDRLLLTIIYQSRRTLHRAKLLLKDLEQPLSETIDSVREEHKKSCRRVYRVCLEMHEMLVMISNSRSGMLRCTFSGDELFLFREALKKNVSDGLNASTGNHASRKDMLVRRLLSSDWITQLDTSIEDSSLAKLPKNGELLDMKLIDGFSAEREKALESFEKSLDPRFEAFLEAQKRWTETTLVRDMEWIGDSTSKRLSARHESSLGRYEEESNVRKKVFSARWIKICASKDEILKKLRCAMHWKLPEYLDTKHRRLICVPNTKFDDHLESSYELLMDRQREKEAREKEERDRRKLELAEVIKRNADAFVPVVDEVKLDEDEDEEIIDESRSEDASNMLHEPEADSPIAQTNEIKSNVGNGVDAMANSKADSEDLNHDVDAWAKSFIWSDSESIVARFEPVTLVKLQFLIVGKLLLTTHGLYFLGTEDAVNTVSKEIFNTSSEVDGDHVYRWRLKRLLEVHGRRYMLRQQAIELFFSDSTEIFLNFNSGQKERTRFNAKLRNSCKSPLLFSPKSLNPRMVFRRSNLTELWRKRRISNFDYIMALNRMAGRSFNDISQYPVFPWILCDYESQKLDLTDSRAFRDLAKPVGALNPDRLSQLLERYKQLEDFGFGENERFLYGSHYSSPGVILHFLIRQEPFTSMAIDLQSGRFDCPDRLFFNISESWHGCNTSSSDVKELIPEFFTLPEMFLNTNNFPFGKTQKGDIIHDVRLPPWAKNSAHEFVRMHRLALESDYVSENLHCWIDLIFGYKQRGPEAELAHNVFHHLSYEGAVDLDKITDEIDRLAAESHIQNFGQTPSQLILKEAHPERLSKEECWFPLINNISSTVRLKCHTSGKQYGGKRSNCGSAIKIDVREDQISVVYSDLKIGTYRWNPKSKKTRLRPDRLRPLPNRSVSRSEAVIKRGSTINQNMDGNIISTYVGNESFGITIGGYEKEQVRRKTIMPSRLVSAKDALYTDSSSLIVSCGYWDNTIKVHSMDAWKLECMESGAHRSLIRCLAIANDGGLMISGGDDGIACIWMVDYPDMAASIASGYTQTRLGHSIDGENILSCCHILWGHDSPISCVCISSELNVAASGSLSGTICIHSARSGQYIRSIKPPTKPGRHATVVMKLVLDQHGRLVVHMSDNCLHTYTINGVLLGTIDAGERIHDMLVTGEILVTGGELCHVYIRDLITLKILSGLDLTRHGPIRCLSITSNDLNPAPQNLFIGSDDGMISIVDREEIRVSTGGR